VPLRNPLELFDRNSGAKFLMSAPKPKQREVRSGSILLKKSFGGGGRNFLEPLMRFVRSDVRDHVASQKNDHGLSYRRCRASQRRSCPKISICEIFGVVRFSTFSTVSGVKLAVASADFQK